MKRYQIITAIIQFFAICIALFGVAAQNTEITIFASAALIYYEMGA